MNKRPIAVLTSDVHYSLPTLEKADQVMRMAIDHANKLAVPLIVAGDLHDSKANMRAECVNAMLKTFRKAKSCIVMRGNHDSINERSTEHALNFLPVKDIIAGHPYFFTNVNVALIPYQHDPNELRKIIKSINKTTILIMHQGLVSSNSGEYLQDKSAINPEDVAGRRIISGHYHTRQTIKLPDDGQWDYIGNPYSLSFGEAYDPPKGFQVLYNDGSLEFIDTNMPRHIIVEYNYGDTFQLDAEEDDLVWVKAKGPRAWLNTLKSKDFYAQCRLTTECTDEALEITHNTSKKPAELIDSIIDETSSISDTDKVRLKDIWRGLCES